MAHKTITIPEPTDATDGVLLEVRAGPAMRVTIAYRGDVKMWENGAMPNGMKTKIVAALKAAIAAAKGEWGY